MKRRSAGVLILIAATVITTAAAFIFDIDPPISNVAGAFAAIAVLAIAATFIKVSDEIFFGALIFIFLASPMGSILNLYRTFDPYDKIVHFISGILLAVFGMAIMRQLMIKSKNTELRVFIVPMIFAACMFSSGAAGIWEIFEFTADKLAGGTMQRGMADTITDMVAGNLGALVYGIYAFLSARKGKA